MNKHCLVSCKAENKYKAKLQSMFSENNYYTKFNALVAFFKLKILLLLSYMDDFIFILEYYHLSNCPRKVM